LRWRVRARVDTLQELAHLRQGGILPAAVAWLTGADGQAGAT
jgi:hypothetical protein